MGQMAAMEDLARGMIDFESPDHQVRENMAVPEPRPELHGDLWRFRFPWIKTAVAAPVYNGDLSIVNRTERTFQLWPN